MGPRRVGGGGGSEGAGLVLVELEVAAPFAGGDGGQWLLQDGCFLGGVDRVDLAVAVLDGRVFAGGDALGHAHPGLDALRSGGWVGDLGWAGAVDGGDEAAVDEQDPAAVEPEGRQHSVGGGAVEVAQPDQHRRIGEIGAYCGHSSPLGG